MDIVLPYKNIENIDEENIKDDNGLIGPDNKKFISNIYLFHIINTIIPPLKKSNKYNIIELNIITISNLFKSYRY